MKRIAASLVLGLFTLGAQAWEFELGAVCKSAGAACQQAFDEVAHDAVALIDYKALGPAEATGLFGFGVAAVGSYLPIDEPDDWQAVTGSSHDFDAVGLAGAQVTKGLPGNIDLGAFYTTIPGADVAVYGGELRFAFLEGSTVSPALALRGSYVTTSGIDSIEIDSKAVDLSLSKGFAILTPYIGVGYVWGRAEPSDDTATATGLKEVEVEEAKAYAGLRLSLGPIEITPEVEQLGDKTLYNARLGFSFSIK